MVDTFDFIYTGPSEVAPNTENDIDLQIEFGSAYAWKTMSLDPVPYSDTAEPYVTIFDDEACVCLQTINYHTAPEILPDLLIFV